MIILMKKFHTVRTLGCLRHKMFQKIPNSTSLIPDLRKNLVLSIFFGFSASDWAPFCLYQTNRKNRTASKGDLDTAHKANMTNSRHLKYYFQKNYTKFSVFQVFRFFGDILKFLIYLEIFDISYGIKQPIIMKKFLEKSEKSHFFYFLVILNVSHSRGLIGQQ